MAIFPLAGKPAPKEMLVDLATARKPYYKPSARTWVTRTNWSASGRVDTGFVAARDFHGDAHYASHRPSVITGAVRVLTARCTWARTHTPCPHRAVALR